MEHILPEVYLGRNECQFPLVLGLTLLKDSIVFRAPEPISLWILEHWSQVPCSHNLLLHFSSLASERDFFSYFLRPRRKLVVLAPCLWPPLLSPVSILVWLQWKIPLWPSTDECRLSNYIEPTEINFYDPNRVSPWLPVIVRYLGPILLSTGVPWGG